MIAIFHLYIYIYTVCVCVCVYVAWHGHCWACKICVKFYQCFGHKWYKKPLQRLITVKSTVHKYTRIYFWLFLFEVGESFSHGPTPVIKCIFPINVCHLNSIRNNWNIHHSTVWLSDGLWIQWSLVLYIYPVFASLLSLLMRHWCNHRNYSKRGKERKNK